MKLVQIDKITWVNADAITGITFHSDEGKELLHVHTMDGKQVSAKGADAKGAFTALLTLSVEGR